MAIDEKTAAMMQNWAAWRVGRGLGAGTLAMGHTYDLAGFTSGGRDHTAIVLVDDDAFEVEQAVGAMAPYLNQAIVEYWIRTDTIARKSSRCGCSLRTFWNRLDRAHEQVHAYRRALQERQKREREAYRKAGFSFAF